MVSNTGKLTVLEIKAAPPGKHFGGGELFLHVTEARCYWRMKYRHAGKEKLLALGVYPEVTLSEVRDHTEQWLADYNQEIPHDSLGGLTPAEFRLQNEPATSDLVWH